MDGLYSKSVTDLDYEIHFYLFFNYLFVPFDEGNPNLQKGDKKTETLSQMTTKSHR